MKNSGFVLKIAAATLLLSMVLISASSSISIEQQPASPFVTSQPVMDGSAGISTEAIVGITAAVVAAGATITETANSDSSLTVYHQD